MTTRLVEVVRGPEVESVHFGTVVVVDVGPGSDSGTSACTQASGPATSRQATSVAHRPAAARRPVT